MSYSQKNDGGWGKKNPVVVVSNLAESVTDEDLSELFDDIGKVRKVTMKGSGGAEIVFVNKEDAKKAVETYDKRLLDGRTIKCTLVYALVTSRGSGFNNRYEVGHNNVDAMSHTQKNNGGGGKIKFRCFKCGKEGHKMSTCLKGVASGRVQKRGQFN